MSLIIHRHKLSLEELIRTVVVEEEYPSATVSAIAKLFKNLDQKAFKNSKMILSNIGTKLILNKFAEIGLCQLSTHISSDLELDIIV